MAWITVPGLGWGEFAGWHHYSGNTGGLLQLRSVRMSGVFRFGNLSASVFQQRIPRRNDYRRSWVLPIAGTPQWRRARGRNLYFGPLLHVRGARRSRLHERPQRQYRAGKRGAILHRNAAAAYPVCHRKHTDLFRYSLRVQSGRREPVANVDGNRWLRLPTVSVLGRIGLDPGDE